MIDNVKEFTKITAKGFAKWLMIAVSGTIITVIFSIIILFQNSVPGAEGHSAIALFFGHLLSSNICGFILLAGTPLFVILYFMIGQKVAVQTAVFLLWKNKAEAYIVPKINTIIDAMISQHKSTDALSNKAIVKMKLLNAVKNDKESSVFKRWILRYLFSKVQLDNIDFSNKDLKLSDIISEKVKVFISQITEPSSLFFRLLLILQIALFIVAQFFKP